MAKTEPHRGRIQAQGVNLQESVAWNSPDPPTGDDGRTMLVNLSAMLSASERATRQLAFSQARSFVDKAEAAGGVDAQVYKSYPVPKRKGSDRVDIEVRTGRAFVPPKDPNGESDNGPALIS